LNGAISESLVLAEAAGISRGQAFEVFAGSAVAAPFLEYRRAHFEEHEPLQPQMALALAAKDLRLCRELARELGAELPQCERNAELIESACNAGFASEDVTSLARYLRRRLGEHEQKNEGSIPR
jgi:3-hydroxyisobutyrate dehydrogenase-like beta-hydroxyacid dehydrogenase